MHVDSLREHPSQEGRWPPTGNQPCVVSCGGRSTYSAGLHGRKQPDVSKQGASAQSLPELFKVSVQGITTVELRNLLYYRTG